MSYLLRTFINIVNIYEGQVLEENKEKLKCICFLSQTNQPTKSGKDLKVRALEATPQGSASL